MQTLQNVDIALQLAGEHEASLLMSSRRHRGTNIQRWLGSQLIRIGSWLANEEPMRPVPAR